MQLELIRDYRDPYCSLGYATDTRKKWASIERPWVPHETAPCGVKGVSCVPPGTYRLEPHVSEQHKSVWALVNPQLWVYHWDADVPQHQRGLARTLVLIHVANYASELRGCIALGKMRAKFDARTWMVKNSGDAVNELRMSLSGQIENSITITERLTR